MQDRARAEEERDLDAGVVDEVQHAADEAHRTHGRKAEDDVREVRHRVIGKTPLEMILPKGHAGAEYDGEGRRGHHDLLRPGAAHERAAEAEVDEAHHREGPGLDHRHRVQQGRDRRRRDGGRGQPAVKGENRGLDAEAEEGQHEHRQKLLLMPRGAPHVEDAAEREIEGVCVAAEIHQADEHQRRAGHGVEHVLFARAARLAVHLVHHERQRHQRHKLIAEVEREEVGCIGDARHRAVGEDEEAEEHVLPPLVLHVRKSVDRGHRPQHADDAAEDGADPVRAERDLQHRAERGDMEAHGLRAVKMRQQSGAQHKHGVEADRREGAAVSHRPILRPPDEERGARGEGEEHA